MLTLLNVLRYGGMRNVTKIQLSIKHSEEEYTGLNIEKQ